MLSRVWRRVVSRTPKGCLDLMVAIARGWDWKGVWRNVKSLGRVDSQDILQGRGWQERRFGGKRCELIRAVERCVGLFTEVTATMGGSVSNRTSTSCGPESTVFS
jgi:hypothetical protein